MKDRDNIKQLERTEDKEEGKVLKDQFDVYCNTKKTIENEHRQKKKALQQFYKNEIQLKRVRYLIFLKTCNLASFQHFHLFEICIHFSKSVFKNVDESCFSVFALMIFGEFFE